MDTNQGSLQFAHPSICVEPSQMCGSRTDFPPFASAHVLCSQGKRSQIPAACHFLCLMFLTAALSSSTRSRAWPYPVGKGGTDLGEGREGKPGPRGPSTLSPNSQPEISGRALNGVWALGCQLRTQ